MRNARRRPRRAYGKRPAKPAQLEIVDVVGRPLGTYKNSVCAEPRSELGKRARRTTYSLQREAVRYNPDDGPAALPKCGCKPGYTSDGAGGSIPIDRIRVKVGEDGRSSFSGILRCGSVWCCPVCAAKIGKERTTELRNVLEDHLRTGGALFLTLTTAHEMRHRLRPFRAALMRALRGLRTDRSWRRELDELGYLGDVRTLEVTVGPTSGWHPHFHLVLFFSSEPTEEQRAALEEALYRIWARKVDAQGLPRPQRWAIDQDGKRKGLGVNLESVRNDADSLSKYMAKMGMAFELAQWTAKEGRGGNRSMMQVLMDIHEHRDARDIRVWQEWASGMLGARQFEWSRGRFNLRKLFGIGEQLEDEELVNIEEDGDVVAEIPAAIWTFFARVPGWRPRVLELAESGGGIAVLNFMHRCIDTFREAWKPPPWYLEEVLHHD